MPRTGKASLVHKTLFLLAAGFLFAVVAVMFAASFLLSRPAPTPVFDARSAHTQWQDEMRSQVGPLGPDASASSIRDVRDVLLLRRVTAEDRELHLRLILALTALERGEDGAYGRLRDAYGLTQR